MGYAKFSLLMLGYSQCLWKSIRFVDNRFLWDEYLSSGSSAWDPNQWKCHGGKTGFLKGPTLPCGFGLLN
jgi:hypothetical protein